MSWPDKFVDKRGARGVGGGGQAVKPELIRRDRRNKKRMTSSQNKEPIRIEEESFSVKIRLKIQGVL